MRPTLFMSPIFAMPTTTVREDDRRDHHPDQLDEAVAERPQRGPRLRPDVADDHAEKNSYQNLEVQVRVDRRSIRCACHSHRKSIGSLRRLPNAEPPLLADCRRAVATLRPARLAVSPEPAQRSDGRQPDESVPQQPDPPRGAVAIAVDQLSIRLDFGRRRRRALLSGLGRRYPAREEAEGFRRTDRADLSVVDFFAVQTEPSGTEVHDLNVDRPAPGATPYGSARIGPGSTYDLST